MEGKTVDILKDIGLLRLEPMQLHAVHRLKNKNVIVKFVSRKFAEQAMYNRKKLKDIDLEKHGFPADTKIFVNESLCDAMKFFYFNVRMALKKKLISSRNIWRRRLTLKFDENSNRYYVIGHIEDLVKLNLAEEGNYVNQYGKK